MGHKEKLLFWFASFCSKSESSLCPLYFYLSTETRFLRFIFFIYIFLLIKKSLDVIMLSIICFLKFLLLSRFRLVFLPTTLASVPPGVMLLNRNTVPRDSATDIEKTSRKGTSERERPNRSVVKTVMSR